MITPASQPATAPTMRRMISPCAVIAPVLLDYAAEPL
jgi:hypothetical protein